MHAKTCERSLENKIRTGSAYAALVVSGVFQPVHDDTASTMPDGALFTSVAFAVQTMYKGERRADVLHWSMPIYTRSAPEGAAAVEEGTPGSIALFMQDLQQLERPLEAGDINKQDYRAACSTLRSRLLRTPEASAQRLFVIHVRPGASDAPYREAEVPIEMGKPYILFLSRDVQMPYTDDLHTGAFDVYPDEALIREYFMQALNKGANP